MYYMLTITRPFQHRFEAMVDFEELSCTMYVSWTLIYGPSVVVQAYSNQVMIGVKLLLWHKLLFSLLPALDSRCSLCTSGRRR